TAAIAGADQFDPDPTNNTATTAVSPQQADLVLTKTGSDPRPNVGDTVTFTVSVADVGPNAATGVQVTDLLPAGLTFVSATAAQGTYDATTGLWSVGTVAAGTTTTLTVTAQVTAAAAASNVATISHADQSDPNPGNNRAATTVTPQQADLSLTKSVDDGRPNVGDTVTFTVILANQGPDAATGVQVTDPLPAGLTVVSAVP